jgi:sterol desaturase/sphingolipid hydroxylase (fatty acid hydroxylase superfamily)
MAGSAFSPTLLCPFGTFAMITAAGNAHGLSLILLLTFGLMLIEWLYVRLALHNAETHDLKETTTSIATAIGNQIIRPATSFLVAFPLYFAYQHRLFEIPTTIVTLAILFVLVDFAEYWFHRAAHRVRFMWASHAVHHSSTRFNLTAAVRLPWTGPLSGAVFFFVPLTLIGFHPLAVTAMALLNLVYQFFLHTEHAPRLGPLEWVLNTPAHHRVHHASNEHCLDKNFGGVFIIWDRLFGTFAEAATGEKLRFGLVSPLPSQSLFTVNFHEWRKLLRDTWRARGLMARLRVLVGAP